MNIRINGESLEHKRLVVTYLDELCRLLSDGLIESLHIREDAQTVSAVLHPTCHLTEHADAVFVGTELAVDVAVGLHVAIAVEHDDGNGVVAVDDLKDKVEVGKLIGIVE